jgi:hypothetical protein
MTRWGHIFNVIYDITEDDNNGKKNPPSAALKLLNTLCVNINLQRLLRAHEPCLSLQLAQRAFCPRAAEDKIAVNQLENFRLSENENGETESTIELIKNDLMALRAKLLI